MSGWAERALGEVATLNYGFSLPKSKRLPGNVPVYGSNGVVGYHERASVKSSGIMVGRKGSAGQVHFSAGPFCPIDTTFYIAPDDTSLDLVFLFYLLRRLDLSRIRGDVGVPGLNREASYLERVYFPLDLAEQRVIAAVLGKLQAAVAAQQAILDRTAELKAALMAKLFTAGTRGEALVETEMGLVPKSWQVSALRDAVEYIDYGLSEPIPKTAPPNGVKIVSTADIGRDGELYYERIRLIEAAPKQVAKLTLLDGDVLFNWRNSAELIGKTALYESQAEPHIFASFILRIRCDERRCHNQYLKHLLNYYRRLGIFIALSRRAVNQSNYNKNEISALRIPLPPVDEQLRIASKIKLVDEAAERRSTCRKLADELFRSMLDELMTGRIRAHNLEQADLR